MCLSFSGVDDLELKAVANFSVELTRIVEMAVPESQAAIKRDPSVRDIRRNHGSSEPLRHSFGTLLKANGEDVKTVQEFLRHANSRITLDVYTQAVNSNKRAAQSKVVKMMVSNVGTKVADVGTTESKKQAQSAG